MVWMDNRIIHAFTQPIWLPDRFAYSSLVHFTWSRPVVQNDQPLDWLPCHRLEMLDNQSFIIPWWEQHKWNYILYETTGPDQPRKWTMHYTKTIRVVFTWRWNGQCSQTSTRDINFVIKLPTFMEHFVVHLEAKPKPTSINTISEWSSLYLGLSAMLQHASCQDSQ